MRSIAAQEAAISMGRERLARQAIKEGKARPKVLTYQRPGTSSLPCEKDAYGEIAALNRKLSQTASVRDAARLLQASRNARRR
jgi:hypothetical protein